MHVEKFLILGNINNHVKALKMWDVMKTLIKTMKIVENAR